MQLTEGCFQIYGVGAAAAISDIIASHKIFASVFFLLSLSCTLLNTLFSQSLWEGPECEGSCLSRSDGSPHMMAR